jgi:hypothetical protein
MFAQFAGAQVGLEYAETNFVHLKPARHTETVQRRRCTDGRH